jgi:arylsulfatase A-like enzyme
MKRSLVLLVLLPAWLCSLARADQHKSRPNVIVILADDFGYGSLGCYGAPPELKTPHLDRLAREGRRFTHAYAPGSVCSPTRYALMTGRYFWRTSVKDGGVLPGNAPLHIETDRVTLASLCKAQGYRTAAFGKWHLGMGAEKTTDWSGDLRPGPLEIGFDHFFGMGSNPWSGPHSFIEDHAVTGRIPGQSVVVQGAGREQNSTTGIAQPWREDEIMRTLTEHLVSWLSAQRPDQPFFIYYAPNAVHRPVAPHPEFTGSPFGTYGDFIHELDWSVGQVLAALDRRKLADNTLVIFTSDNGGVVNRNNEEVARAIDAGLAINGTLRGGKHDVWEGGFREPFLVRWPGKVPAGTVSDQVICITDVLATLAGILDVPLTKGQAEDSFDVLRAFTEPTPGPPVRDHVIVHSADATYAIRSGDWKLIERVDAPEFEHRNRNAAARAARLKRTAPQRDELFNFKTDPAEAANAIAENGELAARLKQLLIEGRDRGYTRPGAGGER